MSAPRVLMVDEASLGLASATTDEMFAALARLGGGGLAVLLVEQNALGPSAPPTCSTRAGGSREGNYKRKKRVTTSRVPSS